jgi:hypothetical protein
MDKAAMFKRLGEKSFVTQGQEEMKEKLNSLETKLLETSNSLSGLEKQLSKNTAKSPGYAPRNLATALQKKRVELGIGIRSIRYNFILYES